MNQEWASPIDSPLPSLHPDFRQTPLELSFCTGLHNGWTEEGAIERSRGGEAGGHGPSFLPHPGREETYMLTERGREGWRDR